MKNRSKQSQAHKITRIISLILTFALTMPNAAFAAPDASRFTLAPPLAAKPLSVEEAARTHDEWVRNEIMAIKAKGVRLGLSKYTVMELIKENVTARNGRVEISDGLCEAFMKLEDPGLEVSRERRILSRAGIASLSLKKVSPGILSYLGRITDSKFQHDLGHVVYDWQMLQGIFEIMEDAPADFREKLAEFTKVFEEFKLEHDAWKNIFANIGRGKIEEAEEPAFVAALFNQLIIHLSEITLAREGILKYLESREEDFKHEEIFTACLKGIKAYAGETEEYLKFFKTLSDETKNMQKEPPEKKREEGGPIDFASVTPESLKEMFARAKENLSREVGKIISLSSDGNIIRQLEWALSDFNETAHFIIVMAMVSTDEEVSETGYGIFTEANNFSRDVYMNEALYKAVKSCAQGLDMKTLDEEDYKLVNDILTGFRDNGMGLSEEKRERLRAVRKELTDAETKFRQNMNKTKEFLFVDEGDLEGLPQGEIEKFELEGGKRKLCIDYETFELVMPNVKSEQVRREFENKFNNLAVGENRPIVEKILRLRAEAAKILGYQNHAGYVLKDRMAKDVDTVMSFLNELKEPLLDMDKEHMARLLEMKRRDPYAEDKDKIYTWDVKYYMNEIKKEYFDPEAMREYFPAVEVVNTMLEIFSENLELNFVELKDAPVWQKDVRAFEVRDKENNSIGYFYLDLFPRDNKEKYKAMAAGIVSGRILADGTYRKPVSIMISNCPKNFTHRDVEVFFHEFGHVMHDLLSRAKYARFSGTNVKHDYVETPSNTFQEFAWQPEILKRLSGGRIPDEIIEKMIECHKMEEIHHALGTIARATFDIKCHTEEVKDLEKLIHECFADCGIYMPEDQSYFNGASLGHIMEGYDAGYYGYQWSESYMRDIIARFKREGISNKNVWNDLKRFILIWGGSRDEERQLEDFLGRKPSNKEFLEFFGIKPLSPEKEKIHSTLFADNIKLMQAKPDAEPIILALGTSWIKGYEKGESLQYNALNPLIASIREYCKDRGITFIDKDDKDLLSAIEKEKATNPKARVIVLADESTVTSNQFSDLREDEKTFLVGVNAEELTVDTYMRLIEMLTLTLKLASGRVVDTNNPNMSISKDKKFSQVYIFTPHAEPMDYEEFKEIYRVQIFA